MSKQNTQFVPSESESDFIDCIISVENTITHRRPSLTMPKVLRGGRWGSVQSRSTSNATKGTRIQTTRDISRDPHDDALHLMILSFVEERKQLGIAGYDVSANEIKVSKVSTEDDYADAARIVSSLEKYHVVLPTSYKDNEKLLRALSKAKPSASAPDNQDEDVSNAASGSGAGGTSRPASRRSEDSAGESTTTFHIPNHEFGLAKAAELCSLITVLGMPSDLRPDERISFLSHVLQDDSSIIRSVGGLLSFLIGNGVFGSLMKDDDSIHLNAICHENFGDVMRMTSTTLRALHVFSQDTHPVGDGSLRGKEGFSLFGILKSHAKTPAARKLLRTWLQHPATNLEKIQQRQFLVEIMKGTSNRALLVTIKESLRGIRNVPGILTRFKQVCADASDWKALHSSAKAFVALLETLKVTAQQNEALLKSKLIVDAISVPKTHLRETVNWIDAVADLEESVIQGRMIVAAGFSEEIDGLRRSYAALDEFLTKVGLEELKTLLTRSDAVDIETLKATYEPQIGFLIALEEEECERVGQDVLQEQGLSFVFRSEDHRYFKNKRCKELDNDPGDIHGLICDLEAKAFRYLVTKILGYSPSLLKMFRFATEIDCLQALASAAAEYGWVCPSLSVECADLEIEDGRHPLLELTVPSFVPNSTRMRSGDVHVLTGPNYSGKSVYLTQVALIIILAQVGSFVPAKKARIGLVGGINCRISSFESVSFEQSSFFSDAVQVASMMKGGPGRSLNLIDEFGKGTLEVDGMALLVAVLRRFLRTEGKEAPFTICATHFTEILNEPFLPLGNDRLGLSSMEVLTKPVSHPKNIPQGASMIGPESSTTETASTPRPGSLKLRSRRREGRSDDANDISAVVRTYRLLTGSICEESRALQCALEVGVEKSVLERAAHIRSAIATDERIEDTVATVSNSPRIRSLLNTVRSFKSMPIAEERD